MAYVVSIHRHLAPTMGPIAASAGFTRWAGPRTYTIGCIASGSVCMPVEPVFDEATPMMIDVPIRHADSDEDSDDEALPSVVVAAMENLSVLFSDLRLNDGPRYFGEDFDVEALCASFSRLSAPASAGSLSLRCLPTTFTPVTSSSSTALHRR